MKFRSELSAMKVTYLVILVTKEQKLIAREYVGGSYHSLSNIMGVGRALLTWQEGEIDLHQLVANSDIEAPLVGILTAAVNAALQVAGATLQRADRTNYDFRSGTLMAYIYLDRKHTSDEQNSLFDIAGVQRTIRRREQAD